MADQSPASVTSVLGDLVEGQLNVTGQDIFESVYASTAEVVVEEWKRQISTDRALRNVYAMWVFGLVTFQILFVFSIVVALAFNLIELSETVLTVLIPSVLAEVFGMGFIVVKYLFTQPDSSILNILAIMSKRDGS